MKDTKACSTSCEEASLFEAKRDKGFGKDWSSAERHRKDRRVVPEDTRINCLCLILIIDWNRLYNIIINILENIMSSADLSQHINL